MRILKLHFENINSLRGVHTVDFTDKRLAENGLFAITGPTGSGKSSLLDVILLALFNKIPRMDGLSKTVVDQYGAIITRNTQSCFAEIEYESKGNRYRSKWSISYNRNNKLRDYEMELVELPSNTILSTRKVDVPKLNVENIGLDYDQFIKSVILSQGEFARFLKAKAEERTELLEKITGTEIYRRIGQLSFEQHKQERQKLESIQNQLASIELLKPEERQQNTQQQNTINQQLLTDEKEAKNQTTQIQEKQRLVKLDEKVKQLTQLQQQWQTKQQQFAPEEEKLQLYQQLVELKADFRENKQLTQQLTELDSDQQNTLQKEQQRNKSQLEQEILQDKLQQQFEKANKEYQQLQPTLKQVRQYDESIAVLKSQAVQKAQNHKALLQQLDTITQEQQLQTKAFDTTNQEIEQVQNWLSQHAALINLPQDLSLISNHEQQFSQQENKARKQITQHSKLASIAQLQLPKRITQLTELTDRNNTKSIEIQQLITQQNTSENKCKTQLAKTEKDLITLHKVLPLSKQFSEGKQELERLLIQQKVQTETLLKNKEQFTRLTNESKIQELRLQELQLRYEREQREAKYADDRLTLQPKEPCALCGSTHHPYIENYISNINETKKAVDQQQATVKELLFELNKVDKTLTLQQGEQSQNKQQTEKLSTKQTTIQEQYTITSSYLKDSYPIDDYTALQAQLESSTLKQDALKKQLLQFEQLHTLQQEQEQLQQILTAQHEAKNYRSIFLTSLKPYHAFLQKEAPDKIIDRLRELSTQYTTQQQKLQEAKQQLKTLEVELKQLQKNQQEYTLQTNAAAKEFHTTSQQLSDSVAKREALLPQETPEEAEKKQLTNIDRCKTQIAENKTQLATLASQATHINNQLQQLKTTKSNTSTQQQKIYKKLLSSTQPLGFNTIVQAEQAILTAEQATHIRQQQQQLNEEKTSLAEQTKQTQLELERTQNNITETTSKTPLLKLKEQHEQLVLYIKQQQQLIGQLQERLETDNKRQKENQTFVKQLEVQHIETERWRRLDDLIGDAKGKKFSLIAQQLTLRQLVHIANKHLATINDRYLIKQESGNIKESLVVVDTYQGNTERSVKTLSGGESFLVSLSLALGLSDLAGQNARIESLFIDEGFGTLDQETLDIALDALEKLQHSSQRTIGVISHVPALKERIRAQIELQKSATGFSKIFILPEL